DLKPIQKKQISSEMGNAQTPPRDANAAIERKADLNGLQEEFDTFVTLAGSIQNESAFLQRRITQTETAYETELADVRESLDSVANERALLELELGSLRNDHNELIARNTEKEHELSAALKKLQHVEGLMNRALGENQSLKVENQKLRGQVSKLEASLRDVRKELKDEMLRRVEEENRSQTLEEELEFQKNLHSEELRETKRHHESRMVELDNGHQQDFESKLADALMDMRSQHELQIKLYKEEIEKTYKSQVDQRLIFIGNLVTIGLESMIREAYLREQENTRHLLGEKDRELAEMRHRIQQQQHNMTLDEFSSFKKKLKCNNEKLSLSLSPALVRGTGSPSSSLAVDSRSVHNTTKRRHPNDKDSEASSFAGGAVHNNAKRRRPNDKDSEASSFAGGAVTRTHVRQQMSASGRVIVDEVDLDGKYVRLSNTADEDQKLGKWLVKRQVGSPTPIVFKFPADFTLKAGKTVTIWAANAGGIHKPPSDLVWKTQSSWGTGDRFQTTLISAGGEVLQHVPHTASTPPPHTHTHTHAKIQALFPEMFPENLLS
uniref:Lamin-A-like n=1 Tax=Gouania willdenowi TaxID=441366 RepID=A0A8C5NBA8_GOUWI